MKSIFYALVRALTTREFRKNLKHLLTFRDVYYDFLRARRYSNWLVPDDEQLEVMIAFYYHKIEKGLSLPSLRPNFGWEVVIKLLELIEIHRKRNLTNSHIIESALSALKAYQMTALDQNSSNYDYKFDLLEQTFHAHGLQDKDPDTPIEHSLGYPDDPINEFHRLMLERRSVRNFKSMGVPLKVILEALSIATLTPSACNRQPWTAHVISDPSKISDILSLQNGNRGFCENLKTLMVISVDRRSFFDGTERNQAFIEGGLFSAALVFAFKSLNVDSCCLNWCVSENRKKQLAERINLKEHDEVIMLLAVGYANDNILVPLSKRPHASSFLIQHK